MSAGDLLQMEYVGQVGCPTPACPSLADVVDIGQRRFLICQRCGAHRGKTGSTFAQIRREYIEHEMWVREHQSPREVK